MIDIKKGSDGSISVGDHHIVVRHPDGEEKTCYACNYIALSDGIPVATFEAEDLAVQFAYEQEVLSMKLGDFTNSGRFSRVCLAYTEARAALVFRMEESLQWEQDRDRTLRSAFDRTASPQKEAQDTNETK